MKGSSRKTSFVNDFAIPGDTGSKAVGNGTPGPRKAEDLIARILLEYFETEKPYLDEELTLIKLAAQLGVSRSSLSAAINYNLGINFITLVNNYRIEEVKRLIADPKNKDLTLLSLAPESGFPSKSSFHEIFRKMTGMTPREYRQKGAPEGKKHRA